MYTSLLGNVTLAPAAWTDILSLSLDPGVWVLMGTTVCEYDSVGADATLRFTNGLVTFGSTEIGQFLNKHFPTAPSNNVAPMSAVGVADLSLAIGPTTVTMQVYTDEIAGANVTRLARASTYGRGSAGCTWLMAFVDASAKIDQILAAVQKAYPQT